MGVPVIEILWDMEKFYDTLDPVAVGRAGLKFNYPAVPLYLGLLVHSSARVISANSCISDFVVPERSILAGCTQSIAWTRLFLFELLDYLHRAYRPTTIQSWVDDLSQRTQGPESLVTRMAEACAVELAQGIADRGGKVSNKSIIMASSSRLAKRVQTSLEARGFSLKVAQTGRDLGVDATCTKRRSIKVFKHRYRLGMNRAARIASLTRVTKKAKKLANTGARPQLTWGHQAKGVAPTMIRKIKAALGHATGARRRGVCTTTAIMLDQEVGKDPEVFLRVELLVTWLEAMCAMKGRMFSVKWVWKRLTERLRVKSRWSRVSGHMAAVIATLLDISWKPLEPLKWEDSQGDIWEIDPEAPEAAYQLRALLTQQISMAIWKRAAKHYCGAGLEQGADLTSSRKHCRWWERNAMPGHAALSLTWAQGAMWTRSRKSQCGYNVQELCPRCNRAVDTPFHQVWECKHNESIDSPWVRDTQRLQARAQQEKDEYPCFWIRGVVPAEWTTAQIPPVPEEPIVRVWGALSQELYHLPVGAFMATDASGGDYSADPRLRRVGWGLVAFTSDLKLLGFRFGTLPPGEQTVPRGELYAAWQAVSCTSGGEELLSDSDYVVKGHRRGPRAVHDKWQDIWRNLWECLGQSARPLPINKVKAHMTVEHLLEGKISLQHYVANLCADVLAGLGAGLAQVPEQAAKQCHFYDGLAWKVQARIVEVALQALQATPEQERAFPDRGQARAQRPREQMRQRRIRLLRQALSSTGHSVVLLGTRKVHCKRCLQSRPVSGSLKWLGQECGQNAVVHASHRRRVHRGLNYCSSCGAWGSFRCQRLRHPCTGRLTVAGRMALRDIARGHMPLGLREWPDGSVVLEVLD